MLAKVPAPENDVIEIDEICVRVSPSYWVWIAVSRLVGQVLGFTVGDRTDAMLESAWSDVTEDYRNKPVKTDHLGGYKRFFSPEQHEACDKGSGQTSRAESWNTKWRQRQSGLVRRSCGVCHRIIDDLYERLLILIDQHNRQCKKDWENQQKQTNLTIA